MGGLEGERAQELVSKQLSLGRRKGAPRQLGQERAHHREERSRDQMMKSQRLDKIKYQPHSRNNNLGLHLMAVLCFWPRLY